MELQDVNYIKLSQGKVAIVDSNVYEELNKHKWCALKSGHTYYAGRQIKTASGRSFTRMHHYILGFTAGDTHIDHVNGNGLDNRIVNLRMVTKRQNCQNRRYAKKSSEYPGVYWNKCASKWVAQITIKGKWKYLGLYTDELDASKAYERAVKQLDDTVIKL